MAVWGNIDGVNEEVAYEYQTYGGQEYISFLVNFGGSVSAGPIGVGGANAGFPLFPFNGSVWSAFQTALGAAHVAESNLPLPFNKVSPSMTITRNRCKGAPTA